MDDQELERLLADLESDRVERKSAATDLDPIRKAVCAFANDLPGHGAPGVVFVGVDDRGGHTGLSVTDDLLKRLTEVRSDGKTVPMPVIAVDRRVLLGRDTAVIVVLPAEAPPVSFGVGIAIARRACADNGNPPPEFEVEHNRVAVIVRKRAES